MSAKKTITQPREHPVPDGEFQFIVLAAQTVADMGGELESGTARNPKDHGKVIKAIGKDIRKALTGKPAKKQAAAAAPKNATAAELKGDPTWCYNNVYLPCVKAGGSNCYQKYLACCAS